MGDGLSNFIYSMKQGRVVSRAEHILDKILSRLAPRIIMSGDHVSQSRIISKIFLRYHVDEDGLITDT